MKRLVALAGAGLMSAGSMLNGCAARPAATPPPPKIAFEAPQRSATPPPPTGAELLAVQPAEVREAVKQHEQHGRWPIYKKSDAILYPYGGGPSPIVDCAPLRTTDIQLGAGETVTDLALGDAERWMATPASSGDPHNPTPHIALKPQAVGLETNLTIYTTRHIYHLVLRSRGRAMQEVEFYYPDDLLSAMADADAAAAKSKAANASDPLAEDTVNGAVKSAAVDPAAFNFSYKIDGPNLPFRPIRAFDDGSHVYIQMGQEMKTSEAPALLIAAGRGTQMVNYRVDGNYYVVDRLFNQAELVTGVGREQDRVTIAYAGATRD
jgi:type IV secretion system protein TrbG